MKTGWLAVLVSSLGLIATRAAAQPNLTGPIKIAIVGPRLKPGLRATFSWFVPLPKIPQGLEAEGEPAAFVPSKAPLATNQRPKGYTNIGRHTTRVLGNFRLRVLVASGVSGITVPQLVDRHGKNVIAAETPLECSTLFTEPAGEELRELRYRAGVPPSDGPDRRAHRRASKVAARVAPTVTPRAVNCSYSDLVGCRGAFPASHRRVDSFSVPDAYGMCARCSPRSAWCLGMRGPACIR